MVVDDLVGRPGGDEPASGRFDRWLRRCVEGGGDRVGAQVDAEFGFEAGDDLAGGGEHLVGGGFDELDVGAGPVGDVGDRVGAGVDTEDVADDVGDGFGFDFDPVAGHAGFADLGVVHQDVAEFVDLGLQRLRRGEVVANGDGAFDEVGDALRSVGSVERAAVQGVAGGVDLVGDRFPDRLRRFRSSDREQFVPSLVHASAHAGVVRELLRVVVCGADVSKQVCSGAVQPIPMSAAIA